MAWRGRIKKKESTYKYKKTRPKFWVSEDKKIYFCETTIVHWDESEEVYRSGFPLRKYGEQSPIVLRSLQDLFVKEVNYVYQKKKKELIESGYVKKFE